MNSIIIILITKLNLMLIKVNLKCYNDFYYRYQMILKSNDTEIECLLYNEIRIGL